MNSDQMKSSSSVFF